MPFTPLPPPPHLTPTLGLDVLIYRTASMDPEPMANPHAELVTESFQECPALKRPARDWSPATPPDSKLLRGPGWGDVVKPAVDEEEARSREGEVLDVLFKGGYWRER